LVFGSGLGLAFHRWTDKGHVFADKGRIFTDKEAQLQTVGPNIRIHIFIAEKNVHTTYGLLNSQTYDIAPERLFIVLHVN